MSLCITRSEQILDTDIREGLQLLSEFDAEMIEKNLSPGEIANMLCCGNFLALCRSTAELMCFRFFEEQVVL